MIYKDLNNYGKQLKKIPIKDWHTIAWFNKVVKSYLKMVRINKIKCKDCGYVKPIHKMDGLICPKCRIVLKYN